MNIKTLSLMIALSGIALLQNSVSEAQVISDAGEAISSFGKKELADLLNGKEVQIGGTTWFGASGFQGTFGGEILPSDLEVKEKTPSLDGKKIFIKYALKKKPEDVRELTVLHR